MRGGVLKHRERCTLNGASLVFLTFPFCDLHHWSRRSCVSAINLLLHHQGAYCGPNDEGAGISETSLNFYQIARRNNPEHGHLHTRCLKSDYACSIHFLRPQFCASHRLYCGFRCRRPCGSGRKRKIGWPSRTSSSTAASEAPRSCRRWRATAHCRPRLVS